MNSITSLFEGLVPLRVFQLAHRGKSCPMAVAFGSGSFQKHIFIKNLLYPLACRFDIFDKLFASYFLLTGVGWSSRRDSF